MSIQYHGNEETARNTWNALCAKNGLPEAMDKGPNVSSYNNKDLHEIRKTTRLAINKITDSLKPDDYGNNATADGLLYAGNLVSAVNTQFERQEDAAIFFGKKQGATDCSVNVMRNAADFSKHYGNTEAGHEGEIGIADFLRGVSGLRSTPAVQNALSVGTDASGGFTVPGILMPGILGAMVPVSSLMQAGAGIVTLEEGAKTFTTAAINAIPTAAWRAEAGTLATSDPAFRAVVATPHSLSFQFKISRELLADGVGIQVALYQAIAQAFAKELDRAGLRGTGTAPEPRGILNTSGIQTVTNGTNGAAVANYANVLSAVSAILAADAPMPTAAIMSPRNLVKFGSLVSTTGEYLDAPSMLQGVKMIATSQIPNNLTVNTSSDCSEMYLGTFENLYFAMRESVSIQMLRELYSATGEIGFACHLRADVVVTYPAAFALVTGIRA